MQHDHHHGEPIQELSLWVMNISNYDAHLLGAAPAVEQLGPLVFRKYEQRYDMQRLGFFKEQVTFKPR